MISLLESNGRAVGWSTENMGYFYKSIKGFGSNIIQIVSFSKRKLSDACFSSEIQNYTLWGCFFELGRMKNTDFTLNEKIKELHLNIVDVRKCFLFGPC
jgi:hypothetical protein